MASLKLYLKVILLQFRRSTQRSKDNKLILLGLLVILLGSFFGYQKVRENFIKPVVREGIVGTFTERDIPDTVNSLLSQSLITLDKTGSPSANLAASWTASLDGKVYTVKLKDNLKWVDQSPLKAGELAFNLADVESKALDDKTLEFKLAESYSPFPTLLTKPVLKKGTLIGTGPYTLSNLKKDQIFVKELKLEPSVDGMSQVVIKFFPSEKIAKNALKLGEIEVLIGLKELKDVGDSKIYKIDSRQNSHQVVTIFYNTKDKTLSDENLRLALSFASPSITGELEAKTSLYPQSWAFNENVKDFLNNPDQANSYLKKVQNVESLKKSEEPVIALTTTSALEDIGRKVIEEWNKLGVNSVLRVESGIPQNFQALLIAQNIPADPDQYSLWHSTQTQTNISKISSPRIDKDLEDGRRTLDPKVRKEKYADFQRVLLDEAPATFLYFPKYNVVYLKKAEGKLKQVLDLQLSNL